MPGLVPSRSGLEPRIAQRRPLAQPLDLFLGFHQAQADVLAIEQHDVELLCERVALGHHERSNKTNALCAAALQLLDGLAHTAVLAPAHVDAARDAPRERHVVEPLDVHDHGLARLENDVGLDRSRPAGHPLRRVAGAMIGDDEQVIDLRALHHAAERGMAPRVLGV
jgi:hypothetical protein